MPIKLSVAVITYNEEKNISRCLDSVSKIADEILVIDSGSQDNTVELAVKRGAKVLENPFEGHIEQKNFALKHCKNDFVLSIDADEALSDLLSDSIERIKQNPEKDAYEFNRLTNYKGAWIRHSGWYPDKKTRLFDRKKAKWGGSNPHDKIVPNSDARVGYLKGDLLHYSYHSLSDHLKQIEFFTGIMAKDLVSKGKKPSLFKELFSPVFKFFQSYFFQLGFLDGYAGYQICKISAFATYMKYARLREEYQKRA